MSAIFLSASVPIKGRGNYYESADPFLIQFAVRELVTAVIKHQQIVWGGHPSITPMIQIICQDLNSDYLKSVILYQSKFFEEQFPQENRDFNNVILIDAVPGDRDLSLLRMREAMLSREDLKAAVFIGGMEGVEIEYEMFKHYHPDAKVLPVAAPGGAARELAKRLDRKTAGQGRDRFDKEALNDVDFVRLFHTELRELTS